MSYEHESAVAGVGGDGYQTPPTSSIGSPGDSFADAPAGDSTSTTGVAKDQGKQVAQEAAQTGQRVADVATDQAKTAASEAASQASSLVDEARSQLGAQAAAQQNNLATWVRSLADELSGMVDRSGSGARDDGPATTGSATALVRQASDRAQSAASWLEQHEPADVLGEVSRFARRRPGTFLAVAAVAGLLAGRLTRGLTAGTSSTSPHTSGSDADMRTVSSSYLPQSTDQPVSSGTAPTASTTTSAVTDEEWPSDPFADADDHSSPNAEYGEEPMGTYGQGQR